MMTDNKLTHNAYTVGWVCALPKEQTAATAMLDERHPDLPKPSKDPNTYTLGSIGSHNIVIACLPKGKIGTVSAASVATHMIHAFPAIRFGLMVGIGGGVPRHVRLGDVVVSVPTDQYPGVIQWDMGKTEQGGSFRRTGALNNPPTLLLTALTRLETDHELHGSKIPQYIGQLRERYPKMAAQYMRSAELDDVLFKTIYDHVDRKHEGMVEDEEMGEESDDEDGDSCRHCDKSQILKRKPRDMRVHYGLIASGNQVIKDARSREQLSTNLGQKVLCIDMEAAGLMDGFPCVVIRGICDYADSHKNKAWQKYAAAVAAAFAKELLGYVIAEEVSGERPVSALLENIWESVNTIREDTIRKTQLRNKREDMDIVDWISTDHYGAQQSDTLKRWHPETNRWFLSSAEYQYWLQISGRTLYCSGIPGAGKTIMTSAAVNDIVHQFSTDSNTGLAYIYFSFSRQREQTAESVLASLLTQLLRRQSLLPDYIHGIYQRHKKVTRPVQSEWLTALHRVVSEYKRTFIVLDALDECTSQTRAEIVRCMKSLQSKANINILATSRTHDGIEALLTGDNTINMSIVAHNQDMDIMLHSRMRTFDQEIYDDEFRNRVAAKIIQVAEGMFLLADLHLDALTALPTKGDILDALRNLDRDSDPLNAVYDLAMKRIESQEGGFAQLAKRILFWIIHARRRISTAELQHALAIRPQTRAIDINYCPTIKMIKSICAGLVIVDEGSDSIRLVHYTAQEYFEKTRGKWFPLAQDQITKSCVTYLSFEAFEGHCKTDKELEERLEKFPFYEYASNEWGYHAQLATSDEDVLDFLKKERQVQASIQPAADYYHAEHDQHMHKSTNGLHLASRFGLEMMVKALLFYYDVNVRDCYGQTPLSWAASEGHRGVVELLLAEEAVDINLRDSSDRTPLSRAAGNGHTHIIELLLRMGSIDVNLSDDSGRTPLSWTAFNGHRSVIQQLLCAEDIDVDKTDADFGQTPLSLAAGKGHYSVVELLLKTGKVDVNLKDSYCGETPLLWACKEGNDTVVELLLCDENIDVDRPDNDGRTSLSRAASSGSVTIMELLLCKSGTDIDLPDHRGRTPLSWAASFGHQTVIELMLSTKRVDINLPDDEGRTPLSWAASSGSRAIVELLLFQEGMDADLSDHSGRTPLSWAAFFDHQTVVELLLASERVNVNLPDNLGRTPLSWAASKGHDYIVELILSTGKANVNLPDNLGRTPLSWAASKGYDYVVALILSTGKADVNLPDSSGHTPIMWAIENGWEDVVNGLIDAAEKYDVLSDQQR